jgi:hypothetical protein
MNEILPMNNAQLELSFGLAGTRHVPRPNRQPSPRDPGWWFQRMRQIVDRALDWQPVPPPPPEQIVFPHKDFRLGPA